MLHFQLSLAVESDGDRFHGFCPALPGVHVDGDSADDAFGRLENAAKQHIEALILANEPIPIRGIGGNENSFRSAIQDLGNRLLRRNQASPTLQRCEHSIHVQALSA